MSQSTADAIAKIRSALSDPKTPEDKKEALRIQLRELIEQEMKHEQTLSF